jgi:NAD(P)-dependent dehydrogenase (short-subunit alcohol dehydrogenase family)
MSLAGKCALVTGASRGIGRAVAESLAAAGARIALHYHRRRDAAEEVQAALPGDGHFLVQADLRDAEALPGLTDACLATAGSLDLLVNNAGVFDKHPPMEGDYAAWRKAWESTVSANLLGPAHLSFLAARAMARSGGGRIINISSRGAFRGEPDAPAYGASKAGLNALGQSLALALAPHKVLVFTVAPGWVETDMARETLESPRGEAVRAQSPLNRAARPEEIAAAVRFLAAEAPEYMTGAIIDANGASYLRS